MNMNRSKFVVVAVLAFSMSSFAAARAWAGTPEWHAQWIGASTNGVENTWSVFRKHFMVRAVPKSAVARIAVDSKYWLWINGKQAVFEGGLKRGPNPQDTYYDEVDLAPGCKKGEHDCRAGGSGQGRFQSQEQRQGRISFRSQRRRHGCLFGCELKALIHPAYGTPSGEGRISVCRAQHTLRCARGCRRLDVCRFDDSAWSAAIELGAAGAPP